NDIKQVVVFVRRDEDVGSVECFESLSLGKVEPVVTMIVGATFVHQVVLVKIETDALIVG
ncbi:hypothetical protein DL96DRAFT_1476370, partial [Flagelloscypha sp. PMI_526]